MGQSAFEEQICSSTMMIRPEPSQDPSIRSLLTPRRCGFIAKGVCSGNASSHTSVRCRLADSWVQPSTGMEACAGVASGRVAHPSALWPSPSARRAHLETCLSKLSRRRKILSGMEHPGLGQRNPRASTGSCFRWTVSSWRLRSVLRWKVLGQMAHEYRRTCLRWMCALDFS